MGVIPLGLPRFASIVLYFDFIDMMHTYLCMRTTIDLDDTLFREAKMVAAERGLTLKDLITQAINKCIYDDSPQKDRMNQPPIVLNESVSVGFISNREIAELEANEMDEKLTN